jgi:ATP-dependent Clp protease ATP-binding subunit ClpC
MHESLTVHVPIEIENLSEQLVRGRPLGPWKIQVVGRSWDNIQTRLARRLSKAFATTLPTDIFAGKLPAEHQPWSCSVELPPQERDARWSNPLLIELDCFRWILENGNCVVRIPAVQCTLVGKPFELDEAAVARHAKMALLRIAENLDLLALSSRFARRSYEYRSLPIELPISSPAEASLHQRAQRKKTSALRAAASDLSQAKLPEIYGLDEKVAELADHFMGEAPRSVLLIGPAGVGKTALVHRLVRLASSLGLGERRIWTTSGARIVSGMSGLGMWQQRCSKLIRQAHATAAIVHVGSLFELLEAGKMDGQPGVSAMVRQSLSRGKFLAIAECTAEQLAFIEREDPMLLRAFVHMEMKEQPADKICDILSHAAQHEQGTTQIEFTAQAIEELFRLYSRFATYSALPAVALQLMRTISDELPASSKVQADDVARAFARQTGLPQFLVDDSIPLELPSIASQLSEQVIGQTEPVELIVDLIATLKARLVRPGRPLASLLFIGPTGVGKTEMAKAIARLLYSDASRMLRIDMSEYASPWSVVKLIGKPGDGDGTLTSPIREQPFSVVLLDEFEKADPQVFDILLQMLGEGRLTDSQGRLADFRNAVVIMTSNLGAETFRDSSMGFGENEAANWREHFQREVRKFVRPEFLGRLDRIVPFRPLPRPIVKQIAHRELDKLCQRPGLKYRDTTLHFDESAIELLCDLGFQPKYGARPLRRAIESHVTVPVANALSNLPPHHTWILEVTAEAGEFLVQPRKQSTKSKSDKQLAQEIINDWQQLGRMARTARRSGPVRDLENELERALRQHETVERRLLVAQGPSRLAALRTQLQQGQAMIEVSRRIRAQLFEVIERICHSHLGLLTSWQRGAQLDWGFWRNDHSAELTQLRQATEDVVRRRLSASDCVSLIINGRSEPHLQILWKAYRQLASDNRWRFDAYLLYEYDPQRPNRPQTPRRSNLADGAETNDLQGPALQLYARARAQRDATQQALADAYRLDDSFRTSHDVFNPCGLALQFQGSGVESWLENEEGVNHFYDSTATGAKRRQRYRTLVFPLSLVDLGLPMDWLEPAAASVPDPRRLFDLSMQVISNDSQLSTTFSAGKPHDGLLALMRKEHEQALWAGIGYRGIPPQALLSHYDWSEVPY